MLIKFFRNGRGGGAGPVEYLIARTVLAYGDNRDLIRDASGQPMTVTREPLPEVLRGDPQGMIDLIDSCPHQWSYRAGVVSFACADAPTEEQQQDVMDRFEEIAFAGLDVDHYACLWVRHTHEDRVELHFCTPRMELHGGRGLMVPRHEVELVDMTDDPAAVVARFRDTDHSRLPVRDGGPDDIVGVVKSRDFLDAGHPARRRNCAT